MKISRTAGCNVREKPDFAHKPIEYLLQNEIVEIKNDFGFWVEIELQTTEGSKSGYVQKTCLTPVVEKAEAMPDVGIPGRTPSGFNVFSKEKTIMLSILGAVTGLFLWKGMK